jgi:predicted component of type VI protein secretion system
MKGVASRVMPNGTPPDIIAAAEAEIDWWSSASRRASELWRWTAADEFSARAIVGRLGYGDLARSMTGRDVVVLLALIPHFPSIAHSGRSLAAALQRWLAVPVRFVPHVASCREIAPEDRSLLRTQYPALGRDLVLGTTLRERASTLAFEADLREPGAIEQVLNDCWVSRKGQRIEASDKLIALLNALIPAALRVECRFLLRPPTRPAYWLLAAKRRLGIDTRLAPRSDPDA